MTCLQTVINNVKTRQQRCLHDSDRMLKSAEEKSCPPVLAPFLKWAGGKRWLAAGRHELLKAPRGRYIEPFLGSGAIFFSMRPKKAILSDMNADLINAFAAIAEDWRAVERRLWGHHRKHSEDYYYAIRASKPRSTAARAARFIYLNRTCWNGLYRVNRKGDFNVPMGTKSTVVMDTDDFEAAAKLLQGAELSCGDFERQIDLALEGDLVFADPPYTVKHKFNGFVKYNETLFAWQDQERLCQALRRAKGRGAQIILTNADHESIRELYSDGFEIFEASRYSSIAGRGGTRGQYSELIIR